MDAAMRRSAKKRSVMVTGGQGFIGRAVGKLLQREGYRVVGLDISAGTQEWERHVVCDVSDVSALRRVFEAEQVEGIIHLAAILPTAAQREPVRATEVNVVGSLNLLEMAREFGVRRFVFGSSLSVYGTCGADDIVAEDHRAAPEDVYGAAKLSVERVGGACAERQGLEFVSLRIGRVVGPGARSATSAWRSQIFELLGTKDAAEIAVPYLAVERVLLVHVDAVAEMLVKLLSTPRLEHGIYNAVCESVVVGDLKREVESLNSNICVKMGDQCAKWNPRLIDCSRYECEFQYRTVPIFQQLSQAREAAGKNPG
jgi:nucleoside-diphosphate-sugar epimerase